MFFLQRLWEIVRGIRYIATLNDGSKVYSNCWVDERRTDLYGDGSTIYFRNGTIYGIHTQVQCGSGTIVVRKRGIYSSQTWTV